MESGAWTSLEDTQQLLPGFTLKQQLWGAGALGDHQPKNMSLETLSGNYEVPETYEDQEHSPNTWFLSRNLFVEDFLSLVSEKPGISCLFPPITVIYSFFPGKAGMRTREGQKQLARVTSLFLPCGFWRSSWRCQVANCSDLLRHLSSPGIISSTLESSAENSTEGRRCKYQDSVKYM